ncbi:AAA family ATPase [Planktothrix pseudagardhii]|uniref:ATPase, AAA family n=1 Tax=Planktothrix pseudagardhii TaxID=132604 RepID=A0A9W4D5M3_9CYAN|nr:MoxR family ATPase [Planktothrix pseudagardhii]CAD5949833.1 Putative ATPase, AAA family [Planktothrix pseudagardhii]
MNEPLEYTGEQYQPQPEFNQRGKKRYPYRPEPGLIQAVNLAIALERPILLEGEPGCGKTQLAPAIAYEFSQRYLQGTKEWPYFSWNIKSTTRAQDGLYTYDAIARLRDAQFLGMNNLEQYLKENEIKAVIERLNNQESYVKRGELGKSFEIKENRPIVLIDEIDKADIDFPNDLLLELDKLYFEIPEIGATGDNAIKAEQSPIVIITSNRERELPDAFLRRCLYYYLKFPDEEELIEIVKLHFPKINLEQRELVDEAVDQFLDIREMGSNRPTAKKAGTSELLDLMKILLNKPVSEAFEDIKDLAGNLPLLGTLLKTKESQDSYQRKRDE